MACHVKCYVTKIIDINIVQTNCNCSNIDNCNCSNIDTCNCSNIYNSTTLITATTATLTPATAATFTIQQHCNCNYSFIDNYNSSNICNCSIIIPPAYELYRGNIVFALSVTIFVYLSVNFSRQGFLRSY